MRGKKKVTVIRKVTMKCKHDYVDAKVTVFPKAEYSRDGFVEDSHFEFKLLLFCRNCSDTTVKHGKF